MAIITSAIRPFGTWAKARIATIKALPVLLVSIVSVLACIPVLLFGIPLGHDGITHASWQTQFYSELTSGTVYPRWLPNSDKGTGSPVFFFYPPLTHYVASLTTMLLCIDCSIFVRLAIGAAIFNLVSGISFYAMARVWLPPAPSALGAVAYLILPYHYGIDLWTRVAYAEFCAYAIAPLVFRSQFRITKRLPDIASLGVSYAALILTHLPSAVILSCVVAACAIVNSIITRSAALLLPTGIGIALGVVLSALYLIPALALQDMTNIHALWEGRRHYSQHFLLQGSDRVFIGEVETMLLLTTAALAVVSGYVWLRAPRHRPVVLSLILGAIACWILMTPISRSLWQGLPILYKIEFPWRFGVVIDLLTASAVALASACALDGSRRLPIMGIALLVVALGSLNIPFMWKGHYSQEPFKKPSRVAEDQRVIRDGQNSAEYQLVRKSAKSATVSSQWTQPAQVDVGNVRILDWKSRHIVLGVSAESVATLTVRQNYVPLWRAIASDGSSLIVAPARDSGLLQIKIPAGETVVTLSLVAPYSERVGYGVTLFGAVAVLAMFSVGILRNAGARKAAI